MKRVRLSRKPGPGEIAVMCPVCHRRYLAAENELIPALVTDYMIYCPHCKEKRHIYAEEIEHGEI